MVKPVCTPDCPDRHPACSDRCEKYRAWKAEVQKEKAYTKSQNDAGKINRNDFDAEFWRKAQITSPRRRWMRAAGGFGDGGSVRPNGCCQRESSGGRRLN